jgi:hypothetical protein
MKDVLIRLIDFVDDNTGSCLFALIIVVMYLSGHC